MSDHDRAAEVYARLVREKVEAEAARLADAAHLERVDPVARRHLLSGQHPHGKRDGSTVKRGN